MLSSYYRWEIKLSKCSHLLNKFVICHRISSPFFQGFFSFGNVQNMPKYLLFFPRFPLWKCPDSCSFTPGIYSISFYSSAQLAYLVRSGQAGSFLGPTLYNHSLPRTGQPFLWHRYYLPRASMFCWVLLSFVRFYTCCLVNRHRDSRT